MLARSLFLFPGKGSSREEGNFGEYSAAVRVITCGNRRRVETADENVPQGLLKGWVPL